MKVLIFWLSCRDNKRVKSVCGYFGIGLISVCKIFFLGSKFCLDSHPHISLLCRSRREGGLGLKKLIDVNRAMLMKLWVSIRDSDKTWTKFLKAKYFKVNGNLIDYKLGSSVFPGIRLVHNFVQRHTRSIIGNGANTSLFFDNWCADFSIAQRLGITKKGPNDFKAKVSDIIVDGSWVIPPKTKELMIRCNIDVDNFPLIGGGDDYKIWDLDSKDVFSVKSAKAAIRGPAEISPAAALFSRSVVHPTLSVQYWKLFHKQCCATDDNIMRKTGREMLLCVACAGRIAKMSAILLGIAKLLRRFGIGQLIFLIYNRKKILWPLTRLQKGGVG